MMPQSWINTNPPNFNVGNWYLNLVVGNPFQNTDFLIFRLGTNISIAPQGLNVDPLPTHLT